MKHAYLVIAHKYDETFKTMISMIDYPDNDIFLHMDIKCTAFDPDELKASIKYSNIYFSKRTDVSWGKFTQIGAELILLKLATSTGKYKYYHLISGQDLPIKSQEYIHEFFENENREFLEVTNDTEGYQYRIWYYHFVSKKLSMKENSLRDRTYVARQEKLGIKRNSKLDIKKGANWFSITDDFARYTVDHISWIKKHFMLSICADELFLQTLLWNSPFKDKLAIDESKKSYSKFMREIDWIHCNGMNPHVYTMEDLETLKNSPNLFARKFDCQTDNEIIHTLKNMYSYNNRLT